MIRLRGVRFLLRKGYEMTAEEQRQRRAAQKKLRIIRLLAGISGRRMALQVGISPDRLSRYENGWIVATDRAFHAMLDYLGVDVLETGEVVAREPHEGVGP